MPPQAGPPGSVPRPTPPPEDSFLAREARHSSIGDPLVVFGCGPAPTWRFFSRKRNKMLLDGGPAGGVRLRTRAPGDLLSERSRTSLERRSRTLAAARTRGSPREGARTEERAEQRLAAGGRQAPPNRIRRERRCTLNRPQPLPTLNSGGLPIRWRMK